MAEAEPLSPRKTVVVLVIVGGCFAVLWPRLLQPALFGAPHDALAPNRADRAQGCCDVMFETDVNTIKMMNELCGELLRRRGGGAGGGGGGRLPADALAACRRDVLAACGVDIAGVLQRGAAQAPAAAQRRLLDQLRTYNSSACLKAHFGVPAWELGRAHAQAAAAAWGQRDADNMKQERPPLAHSPGPHPAMRERGRAIPAPAGAAPPAPAAAAPRLLVGRPPPVPGVRPPLGGAGGALPPPKSSVGFMMPIYTICIVVFFLYTLCKIMFKSTDSTSATYDAVQPDPAFRRRVFDNGTTAPVDPRLVVSAISGLVAEVQQQMETSYAQSNRANSAQDSQEDSTRPYTNGTVHNAREPSPVRIVAKEYKEVISEPTQEITPEPKETPQSKEQTELEDWSLELEEKTPEVDDWSHEPKEKSPEPKELTPEPKAEIPEPKAESWNHKLETPELEANSSEPASELKSDVTRTPTPDKKQTTPELLADALKEDSPQNENGLDDEIAADLNGKQEEKEDEAEEELSEKNIDYEVEEEDEESPIVRQLRASVESEKATVKVLGMEMTAHCEGGAAWGERTASPAPRQRPAAAAARPHEAAEVSSIFLEGDIPQDSRLLVADSATRADHRLSGKDSPVVLSGKMTLSLINDVAKETPERELESPTTLDDDEFTTASAVTQPKQNTQQEEELSEEEVEEEIEEEVEVEEIEVEEEELEEDAENVQPDPSDE